MSELGGAFDIAAAAGWYSAVAGLLAGFALLAILLPLDHEAADPDTTHAGNAVVIYTCAFFSLLILSISYAVLAGRTGDDAALAVAAHEQMLNGVAFGLATLLLLLGLHAILRTYGANREVFAPARELIMVVTSVIAPALVLALQFSNTIELQRFRGAGAAVAADGASAAVALPPGVVTNLVIVGLGIAAILLVAAARDRLPVAVTAPRAIAQAVLGYTVVVILWTSVAVPLLPIEVITSAALEHLLMALTAVGAVAISAASWAGR